MSGMGNDRRGTTPGRGGIESRPAPGTEAMLLAAYTIGIILLGVQLWLLTVALELYLGGEGENAWVLAVISAVVFSGGLLAYRLLSRRPRGPRP